MRFGTQKHDVLEMSVVDVSVNTEQAFEDDLNYIHEVLRKWNSQSTWENFFIVKLIFYPCHQKIDVLSRTYL